MLTPQGELSAKLTEGVSSPAFGMSSAADSAGEAPSVGCADTSPSIGLRIGGGSSHHIAEMPPSSFISAPVMNFDSSDAR